MSDRKKTADDYCREIRESADKPVGGKAAMPAEVPALKDTPGWDRPRWPTEYGPGEQPRGALGGPAPLTPEEMNRRHAEFWGEKTKT